MRPESPRIFIMETYEIGIDHCAVFDSDGGGRHVCTSRRANVDTLMALPRWAKRHFPVALLTINIGPRACS
jgi:hypothetical protein